MPLVIDASALAEAVLRTPRGVDIAERMHASVPDVHVPALCDAEVAAVLRRGLLNGRLSLNRAAEALEDLLDLPLTRHGHQGLLERVLQLRHNFSAYDAVYVALAEKLGASLLTDDLGLARAAQEHAGIELATPGR